MEKRYLNYWGKTTTSDGVSFPKYHPVAYHGLDVAAVFTVLLNRDPRLSSVVQTIKFCNNSARIPLLQLLVALHDVGKFSEAFQNLCPDLYKNLQGITSTLPYYPRHDSGGYLVFSEFLFDQIFNSASAPQITSDPDYVRDDWWELFCPLISAVTGHHGAPPTSVETTLDRIFSQDALDDVFHYAEDCKSLFFRDCKRGECITLTFTEEYLQETSNSSFVLAGSIVLSDWIASNTIWFEYVPQVLPLKKYWDQYALPQAERAVVETGILPAPINQETGFSAIFPQIKIPYPIQQACNHVDLSNGSGLYIIEDLCGMGKTEASLVLAHRLMNQGYGEGIFFALPTMATANAMYTRVGEFYTRFFTPSAFHPEIILTHSMSNSLKDLHLLSSQESDHYAPDGEISGSAEAISWLSDSRKKALLAQVGVGTIDQALMAVLSVRHQSLRLFGLMRNVLIVDEVHSYDPYVHRLLCNLIEYHSSYGGSTILLSATLPISTKRELIQAFRSGTRSFGSEPGCLGYPLLTMCNSVSLSEIVPSDADPVSSQSKKGVTISDVQSWDGIITIIQETIFQGKCVVYIRNTVDDAREAYEIISRQVGTEKILLFHAKFVFSDRIRLENEILNRFGKNGTIEDRKGWVVIATQVLEQSLDVDFDLMITDLAPADLMIQRAGRVQRHDKPEPFRIIDRGPATLIIRAPPLDPVTEDWYERMFPKGSFVYPDHGRLFLSLQAFIKRNQVIFLDDTRDIIEEVYGKDSLSNIPTALIDHTLKAQGKDNTGKTMAGLNVLNRSSGYVFSLIHWDKDVHTPTRLSELSNPVFLGIKSEGHLAPLFGEGLQGWHMSRILIPERLLSKDVFSFNLDFGQFPMRREDCIVLDMEPDTDGWCSYAEDSKGVIKVKYHVKLGLIISRG